MDDAATGGLMYLDAYGVATTDLGRGPHEIPSLSPDLQEVCAIMKPEHGASAVARGPPALIQTGRIHNPQSTIHNLKQRGKTK